MSSNSSLARTIAPHVEPEWVEAALLELRLQGVAGPRIADALAEVESHVTESGLSASASFGDPVEYARSLKLTTSPDQSHGAIAISIGWSFLQLAGMFLTLGAITALRKGEALTISWGMVLSTVIALALTVVFALAFDSIVRSSVSLRPRAILAWVLAFNAVLVPSFVVTQEAFVLPAGPALGVGVACVVAGWAAQTRRALKDGPDTVVSPLSPRREPDAGPRLAIGLRQAVVPLATALLGLIAWFA